MPSSPTPRPLGQSVVHPGLGWLDEALCGQAEDDVLAQFFVEAGRVIDPAVEQMCRERCPVRRECLIHSYVGGIGGTQVAAGYFAALSLGERRALTLEQALARLEQDEAQEHQGLLEL